MKYYSTNHQSPKVNFREAAILGQAPDKGLYFPEYIPKLSAEFLKNLNRKTKTEIAYEVIKPYTGDSIPDKDLIRICENTVNFDFPLVKISDQIFSLELFHGATLAFKDVGARFMSGCLSYFSKDNNREVTVLVATSGDTGSAVANGFLGIEGVKVVILYPSKKVSKIQEQQLTTMGQNITALEVEGTFDDCQRMVKDAFADRQLKSALFLTSANSINVARWLPQQFYYFYAIQQWEEELPPVISVPSGNFGNIGAGLLSTVSGLPVKHFIAACNSNDVFTRYISTGVFAPLNAIPTLSNAMDVGNPSNFVRIMELFKNNYDETRKMISSESINDKTTTETIADVYKKYKYILDPHGAVGFKALENYLQSHPAEKGIFLETAHPIKFNEAVEKTIGRPIEIPASIQHLMQLKKSSIKVKAEFNDLKACLLN